MIDKDIRSIVDLLLYGGAFIGLCAASITALTLNIVDPGFHHGHYVLLVGLATSGLYSAHRVIGLQKLVHITSSDRYSVIRKYKVHIWLYCFLWIALSVWFAIPMLSLKFILWMLPGGTIALAYILPIMSGGRRVRDIGWFKILMIGWSWAWLTAFVPAYVLAGEELGYSILMGVARALFIIAITIPFEIRDLSIDRSVGLETLPQRFGMKQTIIAGYLFLVAVCFLAILISIVYGVPAYGIAMCLTSVLVVWILRMSAKVSDDYFFSGLTDGTMIIALLLYAFINLIMP